MRFFSQLRQVEFIETVHSIIILSTALYLFVQVNHDTRSLWPYYRRNGRRYKYREDRQIKRRKRLTKPELSNNLSGSSVSDSASYYHYHSNHRNHRHANSKRPTVAEHTIESCQLNTTWEAGIGSK